MAYQATVELQKAIKADPLPSSWGSTIMTHLQRYTHCSSVHHVQLLYVLQKAIKGDPLSLGLKLNKVQSLHCFSVNDVLHCSALCYAIKRIHGSSFAPQNYILLVAWRPSGTRLLVEGLTIFVSSTFRPCYACPHPIWQASALDGWTSNAHVHTSDACTPHIIWGKKHEQEMNERTR